MTSINSTPEYMLYINSPHVQRQIYSWIFVAKLLVLLDNLNVQQQEIVVYTTHIVSGSKNEWTRAINYQYAETSKTILNEEKQVSCRPLTLWYHLQKDIKYSIWFKYR